MQYESVCHLDAMWLHWMLVAVVIVSDLWVIEIGHLWGVEDRSEYSNTAGHTSLPSISKH